MNKFKVGQVVLYQNGGRFELGIVKEVIVNKGVAKLGDINYFLGVKNYLQAKDSLSKAEVECLNAIEKCLAWDKFEIPCESYSYRVWYHTGDTTAMTDEYLLKPIVNEYAFDIKRKSANEGE